MTEHADDTASRPGECEKTDEEPEAPAGHTPPVDPRVLAALDGARDPSGAFVRGEDIGPEDAPPMRDESGVSTLTDHILGQLREADGPRSSAELAGNRYRAAVVRRQCAELAEAGLVEPADQDAYRITPLGNRYLDDRKSLRSD